MLNNLCKLCRLNKPIGIFLLIWPVIWGLLVVNYQNTHALYIFIFLMGTVVMRSAGCVINDIADKSFDAKVDRTKDRILAKEALSTKTALLFLFCLLIIALLLLLFLPIACVSDAIIYVSVFLLRLN
jgi:4-hydroxybenzoate polyprenyltransferase